LAGASLVNLVGSVIELATGQPLLSGAWNSPLGWIFTLAVGLFLLWGAVFRARVAWHRRLRAANGDLEAMILAEMSVASPAGLEPPGEPIELLWRATKAARRAHLILFPVFLFVLVGFFGGGVYLLVLTVTNRAGAEWEWIAPAQSLFEWLARLMLVGVLLMLPLLGLIYYVRLLLAVFGQPTGVILGPEGVWSVPPFGHRRLLRWEEIRLWEVDLQGEERRFWLYGIIARVVWKQTPPSKLVSPGGLTPEAFQTRHQEALAYIAARTQLLPQTLDHELVVKEHGQQLPQANAGTEPLEENEESWSDRCR
jgi:hypothetical protein